MAEAAEPEARQGASRYADNRTAEDKAIVVTGSRVTRPNLSSPAPVTVAPDVRNALPALGAARSRRGDWNACTVDDPARSLSGCAAGGRVAEGVALAWRGEWDEAVKAFDRAIADSPRSSSAYLNRGMARRRTGDVAGALADLDRAVRYAPGSARAYYNRSLALREKGDLRRARADEARAAELDERYRVLVR
jgi:tetratricopeptide (TPR) repeat protein